MIRSVKICGLLALVGALSGCERAGHIGRAPEFHEPENPPQERAMYRAALPVEEYDAPPMQQASLWSSGQRSLLGDRRALKPGDILTVVIEINEKAEISNKTARSRDSGEQVQIPGLLGLPQRLNKRLPEGASMEEAVSLKGKSSSAGRGSVKRSEKLTLRVAATVVERLPNGVLAIEGRQQIRVNFELRELLVAGLVRPQDISRQNEITYDKIASARISYGGRGQITDVQQPRYGQQVLDAVLPF